MVTILESKELTLDMIDSVINILKDDSAEKLISQVTSVIFAIGVIIESPHLIDIEQDYIRETVIKMQRFIRLGCYYPELSENNPENTMDMENTNSTYALGERLVRDILEILEHSSSELPDDLKTLGMKVITKPLLKINIDLVRYLVYLSETHYEKQKIHVYYTDACSAVLRVHELLSVSLSKDKFLSTIQSPTYLAVITMTDLIKIS